MADEHHDDDDDLNALPADHGLAKAGPGDPRHTAILKLVNDLQKVFVGTEGDEPPLLDCLNATCVLVAHLCMQMDDPGAAFGTIGMLSKQNLDTMLAEEAAEAGKGKPN